MATIGKLTGLSESHFVDREREFAELKEHLEESIKGEGRLVFVMGEAGIGKSRLLDELSIYAESKGAMFLRGRCLYQENAEPYLPFIDAFGEYISGRRRAEEGKFDLESHTSEDFFSMGFVGFSNGSDLPSEITTQTLEDTGDLVPMGLLPIDTEENGQQSKIPKIDIHQERTRLFEALSQLVADISEGQLLLLVL
ncbi:MAG: ATP-binding protein, partial [Thermoplasmata archaeon]